MMNPRLSRFIRRLSSNGDSSLIADPSRADTLASIAYEDLHRYIGRRLNVGDVPLSTIDGSSRYDRFDG
jgi:hypothetical protein